MAITFPADATDLFAADDASTALLFCCRLSETNPYFINSYKLEEKHLSVTNPYREASQDPSNKLWQKTLAYVFSQYLDLSKKTLSFAFCHEELHQPLKRQEKNASENVVC